MASIPLPALALRPPASPPDPVEQFGRIAALKNMLATAPLQQQALGQENQQRQAQLDSQQSIMDAYKQSGGDLDKTISLASQTGKVLPADIVKIKQASIQQQTEALALLKAKGERALQEADLMQGAHDTVANAPPEQKQAVYQDQATKLAQAGVDTSKLPPQYPGDEPFAMMGLGLKGHKAILADTAEQLGMKKTQAETSKDTAQAGEAAANTALAQSKAAWAQAHGMPVGVPASDVQMADWLAKNPGKGPSDYEVAMKKIVPAYNFNLQNAGATGQGGQPSAIAQGIASGTMKWADAVSPRTPMAVKEAILKEVKGINPNFNSGDFAVEQKVKESMTSGTYSQQLNAISTARNHMSTFRDMADALDNGTIPVLNKAGNAWVQAFGGEAPTNFAVAKEAFAGEVGRALAGAGVTLADRQEAGNNISAANSPKQLHGVIDTVDKLLKGKQDAIKQTFQSGMKGQPNFGQDQSSTIYARDPQGHLHAAPAGTALPAGWKQESH